MRYRAFSSTGACTALPYRERRTRMKCSKCPANKPRTSRKKLWELVNFFSTPAATSSRTGDRDDDAFGPFSNS
eukprot:6604270-Prymnesium_polylepis.1